jgi:hypothetical protein
MCDTAKKDYKLTPYDITVNTITQDNMFKGTIAICIIYAIFAAILMIAAFVSSNIYDLLFNKFLPFTMVYIIGTIIIIMLFATYIMTFKPKKYKKINDFEYISCPDYWKLQTQSEDTVKDIFDPSYPAKLFQYKCVMDDDIFDRAKLFNTDTSSVLQYKMSNNSVNLNANNALRDFYTTAIDSDKFSKSTSNNIHHLYKSITAHDVAHCVKVVDEDDCSGSSEPINNFRYKLTSNALIMNNYKFDKSDSKFLPLTKLTYPNTGHITWSYNNNNTAIVERGGKVFATMKTTIVNWNDVTYEMLLSTFLEEKLKTTTAETQTGWLYLYNISPSSSKFYIYGQLKVDIETKVITYEPLTAIKGYTYVSVPANGVDSIVEYDAAITSDLVNNKNILMGIKVGYTTTQGIGGKNIDFTNFITATKIENGPLLQIYDPALERPDIISTPSDAIYAVNNTKNIPLVCDQVYPLFLAYNEEENDNGYGNELRCAYSRICNVPWSDMHCD